MAIATMASGCAHPPSATPPSVAPPARVELAVIPAESDAFPGAARAMTSSLAQAQVRGVDDTKISKVSLEVVQLSIECVDATGACYQAIGRSLEANRLLFARIEPGPAGKRGARPRALRVTVTLFDVDAKAELRSASRRFASEAEATAGADALVAEVTR